MNLLIVNDECLTADTMKKDIPWAQYGIEEVYVAYNSNAAKSCIKEKTIDIMLCDIEMPGENGLSLLRWVRENKREIECVFLTCHASFTYAQEAIGLGCQDYILIPAKYEEVANVIGRVVNRILEKRNAVRYQEYGKYMMHEQMQQMESKEKKLDQKQIVEEISAYIMKNITDTVLNVDSVSDQFHFHPVYLNRIFKKEKGISVGQFITNERMKMAAVMLETMQYSINDISEKVGYAHYTNFYNMFKKHYGCSPAKYQENYIKKE